MLASSGQGQQANVSQMDWSGRKRATHPNTGRERINLMEVAKDFLEGVEFAADVRGETSRRERSCRLADHPEGGQTSQYKRVFQDRSIQLDLDTRFGLFSPTETLLPILSFIWEW